MNQRIENLLNAVFEKEHHALRQHIDEDELLRFTSSLKEQKLSDVSRAEKRLTWVLEKEQPVILPDERIVFTRTVQKIPEIFTADEWTEIRKAHYIHEMGRVCNICSDNSYTIAVGLEQRRHEAGEALEKFRSRGELKAVFYLETVIRAIDDIEKLADRYADVASKSGREDVFLVLKRVPRYGARSFHEALQFFRILHFSLWASGNYHNTVGRFDQYMAKYLNHDLRSGLLDYEAALELLEEFFISFNKDSDLYPGMQQGDNGQSMVLGGVDENGKDAFNLLSEMCLKASLKLKLIDPKINLRVTKSTPLEVYDQGTELTRQGLGFPQYSNDEVVIPGLLSAGYSLKDARNYVVAACWEFIIPGEGMDIPNITALSFAKVVDAAVKNHLESSRSFGSFMEQVRLGMKRELDLLVPGLKNIYTEPAPLQSLLMDNCIEQGLDVAAGAKYNNYGIHGTGISTAVDSLAAIKKYIFEERSVSAAELIRGIDADFEGSESLWLKLRYEAPKMGNDDDFADDIAVQLLNDFAQLAGELKNERGGCFRPGSGSAMYYLWHANELGASADGRRKGEALSTNFSPSLNVKLKGPLSVVRSFSKPDMKKIMNGGPLTLELHDTVFRNRESIRKVSSLVKAYMDRGGHQLQINAVNRDRLLDAKQHPELHRNLIVRVWGWSGYFTELDEAYQDHIIQRVELTL